MVPYDFLFKGPPGPPGRAGIQAVSVSAKVIYIYMTGFSKTWHHFDIDIYIYILLVILSSAQYIITLVPISYHLLQIA